ncbi:hypothetical protein [Halobacteriovorax sp. JY17]|uniref:hypothetical protein n=1 Tax=Halobacteriovorax sp. JY17 TaxID=2014617 RepID=UPI000C410B67|nr:hypothetical protein [Halobacteriovorax sp. JY17]PIK13851.1 MAG: hypothetical protein CES88_12755 [Halobacteriovorax sp. JY17]
MQFNSNLIQSILGQTQGAKATTADASNALVTPNQGGVTEVSNEFLSLLNETKALANSGVTPEEFIETLDTQDLGLSGGEKKALAKSFIEAFDGELAKEVTSPEEMVKETSSEGILTKLGGQEKSDLSKIIGNDKFLKKTEGVTQLNSKNFPEQIGQNTSETEIVETKIDPKITNGKLISLKEHSSNKVAVGNFQASEDFVANAKVMNADSKEMAELNQKKSFFPNSKNKVLAFNKEQNTINNNIFSGKNPFISGNEVKVSKLQGETTSSLEGLNSNSPMEALSPVLMQTNQSQTGNQTSFGNQANVKVLDFSNINTANSEQLIDKISNYITTSRLEKQEHVELIVKHDSLGHIKVTASKGQLPDQINLEIVANSDKGHQFFKSNEVEMIKSLSNSGVKLSDVKISMGSDFNLQSSEKGERQFNQGQGSQHSRHDGQQASSNHDQGRRDRREQMWNMYRERLGA